MPRGLLTLMFGALILGAVIWGLRGMETAAPNTQATQVSEPRYTAKKAEWTHLNSEGVAEFHLTADTVDYYDDRSAKLQNVMINRLRTGNNPWRLTAPQGTMPTKERRLLLQNPVRAVGTMQSGERVEINTPRLWADGARNELYTSDAVQISSNTWVANSVGLRADLTGETLTLLKNTKVKYGSRP